MKIDRVRQFVLNYSKISSLIAEDAQKKKEVLLYVKEIEAKYSQRVIDIIGRILDVGLAKLYDGIDVDIPLGINLAKLCKDNFVIFVPNHQSHADYLVFNYIAHRRFDIKPRVAGGHNLNIFPIGRIFRGAGCFFIRRTFQNNEVYKKTLEAYLAYLLDRGHPLEFFYEGGRSRTGKLMAPRYGLFQMLLQIYHSLPAEKKRPLLFIPVSIVHEIVPEHKTLVREMEGAKKKPESTTQLLRLFNLINKKFGVVHLKVGQPLKAVEFNEDLKKTVQHLAFDCYRSVGKGMIITPYALLALVFLDHPMGSLTYEDIMTKAWAILDYAKQFDLPLPDVFKDGSTEESLQRALQLYIADGKIKIINNKLLDQKYYVVNENSRMQVLFSKNSILHHFIVPFLINLAWFNIFSGKVKNAAELSNLLLEQRDRLKYEFYLPTTKDLFLQSVEVVRRCTGKVIETLDDCFLFTPGELFAVAKTVSPFANAFRYIFECYYMVTETLLFLSRESFDEERFFKVGREVFELERQHGRFIKYSESYAVPTLKNALKFLIHKGVIVEQDGMMRIPDLNRLAEYKSKYAKDLTEILCLNFEFFQLNR